MNDERNPDSPVEREQVPDHGSDFWNRLDASLADEAGPRSETETSQMPRLAVVDGSAPTTVPAARRLQSKWPLAAAAAALVVLGLGFLAARGGSDPATTTEIVAAPSTSAAAAADGSGQEDGETPDDASDAVDGDVDGDAVPDDGDTNTTEPEPGSDDGADDDGTATTRPEVASIPDFASARGAVGTAEYLPLDQGIPADSTYLANWPERRLTWFAVTDDDTTCADPGYSEIRYVNGSGFTQLIRDPQLRFSGNISHFVVNDAEKMAAWVVACGQQLELHIATLETNGVFDTTTLVWFGEGSNSAALVQWLPNEVSLSAIEPGGELFSITYNVETGLLSRNGGPSRIMVEDGAPASRSSTPFAASPDGRLTYWQGQAAPGTVSECSEPFGSGPSDMLWLRQSEGQWQPAVEDDFPVGSITTAALHTESLGFAFADRCGDDPGRVVIGTQLPDGRIGNVIALDLAPFVPGYASQLFWIDDLTLRIETDNSQFGLGVFRFDYRLDQEVLVQLD